MTNHELNEKLLSLVRAERVRSSEILELINMANERRLYLESGCASLFDYLTKFLGYCESSAYRRMQAARLLREIPSLKEKLGSGRIQLSQMARLQSAAEAQDKPVSLARKREILRTLEGKTLEETKRVLAETLPIAGKNQAQVVFTKDHVQLTLCLSSEQFEKLQKVRALLSHSVPSGSFEEVLEKLCEDKIKKKTELKHAPKDAQSKGRTHINVNLRKAIFAKYNYECQYRDPETGHRCRSKHFLELEHILPLALGGSNAPENLTVLCRAHNQLKARLARLIKVP